MKYNYIISLPPPATSATLYWPSLCPLQADSLFFFCYHYMHMYGCMYECMNSLYYHYMHMDVCMNV